MIICMRAQQRAHVSRLATVPQQAPLEWIVRVSHEHAKLKRAAPRRPWPWPRRSDWAKAASSATSVSAIQSGTAP
jgi:hypothetical protein